MGISNNESLGVCECFLQPLSLSLSLCSGKLAGALESLNRSQEGERERGGRKKRKC